MKSLKVGLGVFLALGAVMSAQETSTPKYEVGVNYSWAAHTYVMTQVDSANGFGSHVRHLRGKGPGGFERTNPGSGEQACFGNCTELPDRLAGNTATAPTAGEAGRKVTSATHDAGSTVVATGQTVPLWARVDSSATRLRSFSGSSGFVKHPFIPARRQRSRYSTSAWAVRPKIAG
jgi:hypothetical protein